MRTIGPKRDRDFVRRAGIGRRQLSPQAFNEELDGPGRTGRRLQVHHARIEADAEEDLSELDQDRFGTLGLGAEQRLAELGEFPRGRRPPVPEKLPVTPVEHAGVEEPVDQVMVDVVRQTKLVSRLGSHPLTVAASSRK